AGTDSSTATRAAEEETLSNDGPKVYALPDRDTGAATAAEITPTPGAAEPLASPSNPAVDELIAKADALSRRGDHGGARATLERALKVKADDAQVWYRLAILNFDEGEYEQAIVAADRCRSLARDDRDLLLRADEVITRAQRGLTGR
ncbi:MAG: tetratricopeptide repeat protein, partial [Gammaproteobacteria bacterium]